MSFMEDDQEDSLPANQFYQIVTEGRQELALKSGGKTIRWKLLAERLAKRHTYFASHTRDQIRARFKYNK